MPIHGTTSTEPVSEAQLRGMLSLLTDRNPKVVAASCKALRAQGAHARPQLEQALREAGPAGLDRNARRLLSLLAAIRFPHAEEEFMDHLVAAPDLEQGVLLLARLVDGGPEPEGVTPALDAMAAKVSESLQGRDDPEAWMQALTGTLVGEHKLSAVPPDQAVPVDALLHGVTAGRGGLPLPLCMTWILVARRVGIPLVGVNMPGHFLMRLDVPGELRVFDAFRGGVPMSRETCARWLDHLGMDGLQLDALGCDDTELLLRSVRNLVSLASTDNDQDLAATGTRILGAAQNRLWR
jgi:regulator of sirC expression with transglutaminase-like and TPR domain